MERIGSIMHKLLGELGIERPVQRYQALLLWPEVVGERISEVTEANRLRNGKLFIRVKNAAWRNELVFYKEELVQKMNRKLGSNVVQEIILI